MENQNPKIPDPAVPLNNQPHDILLAMLLFGEARGETAVAKLAVANVVRNRVLAGRYGGSDWPQVILANKQFSCFNEADVNRPKLLVPLEWAKPEVWGECLEIAQSILFGTAQDNTRRSTHYHDKSMDSKPPFWPKYLDHTIDMGGLRFYRDPKAFHEKPITHLTEELMGQG